MTRKAAMLRAAAGHSAGGGGGGGGFTKDTVADLAVWLKASNLVAAPDDPIGDWQDASDGNHDATSATTQRPLYKATGIGGKPALLFDGVNDQMALAHFTGDGPAGGADFTCFVVFKAVTVADGITHALISKAADPTHYEWENVYNNTSTYIITRQLDGTAHALTSKGTPDTSAHVATSWVDYEVAHKFYLDGGTPGSTSSFTAHVTETGAGLILGARTTSVPDDFYNGYIAEVLFYTRALTDPELATVHTYLGTEYTITVT